MIPVSITAGAARPLSYSRRATSWPRNVSFRTSAEIRALAIWVLLLVIATVLVGMAQVSIRIRATELGYDGLATQQVMQKLQLEERDLQAEVEKLSSDQRLEHVAVIRLGMLRPQKGQRLSLP